MSEGTKLERRCVCTMQAVSDGAWLKPDGGYYPPKPDCADCGGRGSIAVRDLGELEVAAVWVGRCPRCGFENGMYIQYLGYGPPRIEHPPPCLNDDCPGEHCEYVRAWSRPPA